MLARWFVAVQAAIANAMDCSGNQTWKDAILYRDLTGQTHVITGGDSGIGFETAMAMATANATVVLACRDAAQPGGKCQDAVARIVSQTGNALVAALPCDLSSFASVRAFASELRGRVSRVDVLVNNAGIGWNDPRHSSITSDGFDVVFQVNILSPHLLVHELLPLLRNARGRVIHVTSASSFWACRWGRYKRSHGKSCIAVESLPADAKRVFDNTNAYLPNGTYDWNKVKKNSRGGVVSNYGLSKYLMVFHAAELAKREAANGVTAFSLHPGVVDTPMTHGYIDVKKACALAPSPCPRTAQMGATTQSYLAAASLDEIGKESGLYFDSCKSAISVKTIRSLMHRRVAVEKYQAGIMDMFDDMTGFSEISV